MQKTLLTAVIILSTLSSGALAELPSYTFIEGGYSNWSPDGGEGGDGYVIRGSLELSDNFYVSGSHNGIDVDTEIGNFDYSFYEAGAGVKVATGDRASVFVQADYLYRGVDFESESDFFLGYSESNNGHGLSVGMRAMVAEKTEIFSTLSHTQFISNTTVLNMGLRQYVTDNFGVFAELSRNDDKLDVYQLGASLKF